MKFYPELIELINKRQTWAFVGSGVSIASGYPAWEELVHEVLLQVDTKSRTEIADHPSYKKGLSEFVYPSCFDVIEKQIGRRRLIHIIKEIFSGVQLKKNEILECLLEFLFKGYITTNYDDCIETGLSNYISDTWIPVGNTDDELRRTTGGAEKIIWHIHGMISGDKNSKLILTTSDYTKLYQVDNAIKTHIKSLLDNITAVFIGFGFKDHDLMGLLRGNAMFSNPLKPSYAFLGFDDLNNVDLTAQEYLDKYNVRIVPYKMQNKSHAELIKVLNLYSRFALTRKMVFSQKFQVAPSFDPETTSLILYNTTLLSNTAPKNIVSDTNLDTLLKSYMLAAISKGNFTKEKLYEYVTCRMELIEKDNAKYNGDRFDLCFNRLHLNNDILLGPEGIIELTPNSAKQINQAKAKSKNDYEYFIVTLQNRVKKYNIHNALRIKEIALQAHNFIINDIIRKRSIAYARLTSSPEAMKEYNLLATMQSLPSYMSSLENEEEAAVLSNIVLDVLRCPTEDEKKYIGLCLQSVFSLYMLTLDHHVVQEYTKQLLSSDYILDSSLIIQFLAKESKFNDMARKIITSLNSYNNIVLMATNKLITEVYNHINWVSNNFNIASSKLDDYYEYIMGHQYKDNEFLNGYMKEYDTNPLSFHDYITKIFSINSLKKYLIQTGITKALNLAGIVITEFTVEPNSQEFKDLVANITATRKQHASYNNPGQVNAEAEVIMVINERERVDHKNTIFLSNSRILDSDYSCRRIVYTPENIFKLLNLINSYSEVDLTVLADLLMFEIGFSNPVIELGTINSVMHQAVKSSEFENAESKMAFLQSFERHFGENPERAFMDIDPFRRYDVLRRSALQIKMMDEESIKREVEKKTKKQGAGYSNRDLRRLTTAASRSRRRRRREESRKGRKSKRGSKK